MKGQTKSFRNIAKKALSIVIAFMLIIMTLPIITATAAGGDVTGNPAFRVTAYDTSARIEIPYISGATTYTVYSSTHSDADLSALGSDSSKTIVSTSGTYLPTVYTSMLSVGTAYYFYLVTNDGSADTLQSINQEKTWAAAKYWTDPGNYDLSWYGNGSASSFNIGSARQLAGLAVLVDGLNGKTAVDFSGKIIHLTASLDMSAFLWTPVGTAAHLFNGLFNGANYVSGSYVGSNVVKGLHTNAVTNCYNTGAVSFTAASTDDNRGVGGVFGQNQMAASNCYNIGAVTAPNVDNVGGVVGYEFNGSISNCYNTGSVSGAGNVGGVLGNLSNGTVANDYNLGKVTAPGLGAEGGVVGFAYTYGGRFTDTITNCAYLSGTTSYMLGKLDGNYPTSTTGICSNAGDILGIVQTGESGVWAAAPTAYATGGVFSDTSKVNGGYPVLLAFGYTGNDASIDTEISNDGTTYSIKNAYQLDLVRNYLSDSSKIFRLANNIDISPAQYGGSGDWKPLSGAGSGAHAFTGTFNGNGYSVSGIYINNASASYDYYYSLIGKNYGTVENIGLTGGSITTAGSFTVYTAGIVGDNLGGTVQNCFNSCPVTGNQYIAGVAGDNTGSVSGCFNVGPVSGSYSNIGGIIGSGNVSNSYNLGSVYGAGSSMGGVAGNGDATCCFNTGNIMATGASGQKIGGVVGFGSVTYGYNTGNVTGAGTSSQSIGGIVGQSDGSTSYCYNTGAVSGGNDVGGVTGYISAGTVSNTYYYGSSVGIGGTGASQTGTTPFVQMSTSPVTVGDSITVGQQTSFESDWLAALGADFSVGYAYNSTPSADTSITGNTIKTIQADTNGAVIGGTMTITQNSLTSTGFNGPALQIGVPLSPGTVEIQQATPSISVDPISSPSIGDTVTLKATLTDGYSPSGTVDFYDGYRTVGIAEVSGGVATSNYQITSTSGLSITAGYAGDLNNVDAYSLPAVTANVSKRQPTLTLTASPVSPGTYPNSVTFTATLSNVYFSASGQPVKITVDGTEHNVTTASDGTATYSFTPSDIKSYSVSASYAGDTNNNSAASANLSYDVGKGTQTTPTIGLTGGGANVTYGYSNATYTATASGGESSGAYQYRSSNSSAVEVNSATGALTVKDAGTATIYVKRLGDTNYNDSAEDGVLITVAPQTLDATITPNNKQYDGSDSATVNGSIVYSGVIGSDDVSITGGTLAFSDKTAADNKTVTASGYAISGAKAADYTLGAVTVNNADITKKALSVSVNPVTIECGQAIPALTVNVSGFVTGESASNVSGFTAPTASQNYGSTAVPVAGASLDVTYTGGNPTNNYSFSFQNSTTLTIQNNPVEVLPSDINDGAPTANIQGQPADIAQAALSDDDKQKLADGSEVSIYLRVEKISAAQADQAVVASVLNSRTLGQYLDVSLIKNIDGTESNITQTSSPLRITFAIPNNLLASGRTFSVIRVHDGVAATLPDLDSNPDTITIETDRFSTYAIVYTASMVTTSPMENPKTGERTSIIPIEILGLCSLTTVMMIKKRRYKIINKK